MEIIKTEPSGDIPTTLDSANTKLNEKINSTINLIVDCLELNNIDPNVAAEAIVAILGVYCQRSGEEVDEFLLRVGRHMKHVLIWPDQDQYDNSP